MGERFRKRERERVRMERGQQNVHRQPQKESTDSIIVRLVMPTVIGSTDTD